MALGEAVNVFTKLTIGDGLVSQVPAFLISLAAGLIVTRSTQKRTCRSEFMHADLLAAAGAGRDAAASWAMLVFTRLADGAAAGDRRRCLGWRG